jgi:hypothetical protein
MNRRRTLLSRLPINSIGCEIGVWKGEFARHLYNILSPKKMYLIDPWKFEVQYPDRWYGGSAAENQDDMSSLYNMVNSIFRKKSNIEIHRGTIETFLDDYKKNKEMLDWAYIDGNHSYEFVLNDLKYVKKCMTPEGIISGDDLQSQDVQRAVEDFMDVEAQNIKNYEVVDENQFIIYLGDNK